MHQKLLLCIRKYRCLLHMCRVCCILCSQVCY